MNTNFEDAEISVRGYFKVRNEKPKKVAIQKESQQHPILGHGPFYTLTFDIETTADYTQQLRLGYYELRGISKEEIHNKELDGTLCVEDLNTLIEAGFVLGDELFIGDNKRVSSYVESLRNSPEYRNVKIDILTKQQFVGRFYKYAQAGKCNGWKSTTKEYARVVGHNLAFDISRFTIQYGTAGNSKDDFFSGGFWLQLCDCERKSNTCSYHPAIRIKKLGRHKHAFGFRSGFSNTVSTRGFFLDTMTFGLAIAPSKHGAGLAEMGKSFGLPSELLKLDMNKGKFHEAIDKEYIDYLVRDVQTTYYLFRAEMAIYKKWNLSTLPDKIYSNASMAKALLKEFGIPANYSKNWDIPDDIMGHTLSTFHGGRAEAGIRLFPIESILLDMSSDYTAVNYWMRLQDFWTAENVTAKDATEKARRIVRKPNLLVDLQDKNFWKNNLRIIVEIENTSDNAPLILPIRNRFVDGQVNEGLPSITFENSLYFTMADVLASIILNGNIPNIKSAVEFIPSDDKIPTNTFSLMGRRDLTIDLNRDDLWKSLIDLRRTLDNEANRLPDNSSEKEMLKALCGGLKIAGSAGSYGVALETNTIGANNDFEFGFDSDSDNDFNISLETDFDVNANTNRKVWNEKPYKVDIYSLHHIVKGLDKYDEYGKYFAGVIATFIPAGGRLLLAICERLAHNKGLHYAFMDTDSICVSRPQKELGLKEIPRIEFYKRVAEIVRYFDALNPYVNTKHLLKYEPENTIEDIIVNANGSVTLDCGKRKEYLNNDGSLKDEYILYALVVSSKRYCLYNRITNRKSGTMEYIIRKGSSHALGAYIGMSDYQYPSNIRIPTDTELDNSHCRDWVYGLWYQYVEFAEYHREQLRHGRLDFNEYSVKISHYRPTVNKNAWLGKYAMSQYTLSQPSIMKRFENIDGIMPFNFVTILPSPKSLQSKLLDVRKYSPFYLSKVESQKELETAIELEQVYHLQNNAVLSVEFSKMMLTKMSDVLLNHFVTREAKAANGNDVGIMKRRNLQISQVYYVIGRESNRLKMDDAEQTNGEINGKEAGSYPDELAKINRVTGKEIYNTSYNSNDDFKRLSDEQREFVRNNSFTDLLLASLLSTSTITKMRNHPNDTFDIMNLELLDLAMEMLNPDREGGTFYQWAKRISIVKLGELLNLDFYEAQKLHTGKSSWTLDQLHTIADYLNITIGE